MFEINCSILIFITYFMKLAYFYILFGFAHLGSGFLNNMILYSNGNKTLVLFVTYGINAWSTGKIKIIKVNGTIYLMGQS